MSKEVVRGLERCYTKLPLAHLEPAEQHFTVSTRDLEAISLIFKGMKPSVSFLDTGAVDKSCMVWVSINDQFFGLGLWLGWCRG